MNRSKGLRLPGETPRMVVPSRTFDVPTQALLLMGLRVLLLLGLLALVPLCLGPVRATEAGNAPDRAPGRITGHKISGLNPGPFPKPAAAAKPKADPVPPVAEMKPAEVKPADPQPAEVVRVAEAVIPPETVKPSASKPSAYCASIADAAADARFAWQKEQLAVLEKQVEERIAQLEAKRAEYESWLARRNAFLAKADEGVVAIYTKMRADAAALQLANMPDDSAAAILTKLNARTASAILSEMEAARAAQLARRMSDGGKSDPGKDMGKKARESEKS